MLLVKTYLDRSTIHGIGVFAAVAIPRGTAVARYVAGIDSCFDRSLVDTLPQDWRAFLAHYGYSLPGAPDLIYCSLDHARFINHSNTPNLDDTGPVTCAACDIDAGEELTTDYRILCGEEKNDFF